MPLEVVIPNKSVGGNSAALITALNMAAMHIKHAAKGRKA